MVAIPIVYWLIDKHLGFRFAVFFTFSAYANSGLKYLFGAPTLYEVRLTVQEGYSFPSATLRGAPCSGVFGPPPEATLGMAGAAVLIALISFSRIYLGVHYPLTSSAESRWCLSSLADTNCFTPCFTDKVP